VPLADVAGTVSQHFGEAPYFALVTVRTAEGHRQGSGLPSAQARGTPQAERREMLTNPHQDVEKAKGIRVAEWLVGLKADVVLLREDVRGKGPAYVFADAGVETRLTEAANLAQALAEQPDESDSGGVT
jgi:predicted Fe-Mo cluster-binding NifX family protein